MPCYAGGKEITHYAGNPEGCALIGGTYTEPSLMTDAATGGELYGQPPMSLPPTRQIGKSFPGGATQGFWNSDDFNNPLNTNFDGDANFELLRDRAVQKFNIDEYNKPHLGPVSRTSTSEPRMIQTENGLRLMTEEEMVEEDRYNLRQKVLNTFPMVSSFFGKYSDKNKGKIAGQGGTDFEVMTRPNTTIDDGKMGLLGGEPTIPYETVADEQTTATGTVGTPDPKKGTPWAQLAAGAKVTDEDKMALDSVSTPDNYDKVKRAEPSLWKNMQNKDFWFKGIEGGAGGWDNRLFRLGEMMSYMGTPLSKRGDSPAKRWTTASTAAAKAAGTGGLTKAKRQDWRNMIANEDTLIKKFLKQKKGIFSDSKPGTDEYAAAAAKAANYIMIGNQLIADEIEPTPENIQKRANELKDKKKK